MPIDRSILTTEAAENVVKQEDAQHSSGDAGIMSLAVRKDTGAAIAGSDGDYTPLQTDATGNLRVTAASLPLPSGAATAANQATGNSALAAIQTAIEILDNIVAGSEAQVDVVTQPARAATTDTITAKLATDAIQNGTTALTPKFKIIDAAASGNNTIVDAVTSKKIRVLAAFLVSAGTVTARFESGADGTALTGQMNLVANTGFVLPFNPVGWFESASGVLLNLELSAAVSVDGSLVYVEV